MDRRDTSGFVIPPAIHPTLAQCSSYNLPRGTKRKFDGLSLGLGNSSSSDSREQSTGTGCTPVPHPPAKGSNDGSSIDLDLNYVTLGNVGTSRLDKRACDSRSALAKAGLDLELPLSVGPFQSAITDVDLTVATAHNNPCLQPYIMDLVPRADEGSTSARRPSGGQLRSFLDKNVKMSGLSLRQVFPGLKNPAACTSWFVRPQQRSSSTKKCSYTGCVKGARGRSGRCIAHGWGRRCRKEGCGKGAEGKTIFCKAHGCRRRCEQWQIQDFQDEYSKLPAASAARTGKGVTVELACFEKIFSSYLKL